LIQPQQGRHTSRSDAKSDRLHVSGRIYTLDSHSSRRGYPRRQSRRMALGRRMVSGKRLSSLHSFCASTDQHRITPSLFRSTGAEDEWNLCNTLGKEQCLKRLEEHWRSVKRSPSTALSSTTITDTTSSSFITRDDFEQMQSAGLNAIRIPIGYWVVDIRSDEPYVTGQYPYLIQAVQWSSEFGFQVMIDLHGAPGSQNGQDNSGLIGPVLFPSNSSNSDRSLDILRNLTEEFSQDIYGGAVTAIELLNEPRLDDDNFPMSQLKDFYDDGVEVVSSASVGSSPIDIVIHGKSKYSPKHSSHATTNTTPTTDAFWSPSYWSTYTPVANTSQPQFQPQPTLLLDSHQYYAFPPLSNLTRPEILSRICETSQQLKNSSSRPTVIGEFSLETNTSSSSSHHPNHQNDNSPSQSQRTWYRLLFEAQVTAYSPSPTTTTDSSRIRGWYFWTWKTEHEIDTWSYRRGWRDGWIPADVGDRGSFVFPLLGDDGGEEAGCVDVGFEWEAPAEVGGAVRGTESGMWVLWRVGFVVFGWWVLVGWMI
jgi:glucan 1,3-beta-glucosidase